MQLPTVKLLSYSPTEDQILTSIYIAARGCYSDKSAIELCAENAPKEKKIELVKRLIKDRHRTTLTHINFSFSFDKVPIKIATQLTRSQVGTNFDQRSTRYLAKWTKGSRAYDYGVQPIRFRTQEDGKFDIKQTNALLEKCYDLCAETYEKLRSMGVPAEDASYALNLGAYTGLVASFNIISFKHWINTRLLNSTGKAQNEHQELAQIAINEFKLHYPNLYTIIFADLIK